MVGPRVVERAKMKGGIEAVDWVERTATGVVVSKVDWLVRGMVVMREVSWAGRWVRR